MNTSATWASLSAVAGFALLAVTVQGAAITVPNGDFEADYANRQSTGTLGQVNGAPPSWTVSGVNGGTFSPLVASGGYWSAYDSGVHGNLIAFTQGITTFSQMLTDTYQVGQTYTLEVLVGDSYESPSAISDPVNNPNNLAYAVQLRAGNTVLAEASSTTFPTAATHVTAQAIFDVASNPAAIGQPITIAITGFTGGSSTFDNVTLSAVPEPASLSVLALGALGILRRRRRSA